MGCSKVGMLMLPTYHKISESKYGIVRYHTIPYELWIGKGKRGRLDNGQTCHSSVPCDSSGGSSVGRLSLERAIYIFIYLPSYLERIRG